MSETRGGTTGSGACPSASAKSAPAPREQIAGLAIGVLLLDPTLAIAEINVAAESLIGRGARRLVGRRLFDVIGFDDPRIVDRMAEEEVLSARDLSLQIGGRALALDMSVSPLPSHPGWRVMTLSDAGQGERFGDDARIGVLRGPAVLAHEIKNPLAAIRGAAQLLARTSGEEERRLTCLIASEVDRVAALIDRMQRLGRDSPEPVAPCNLHAAIRDACETMRTASDAPFDLREEFDPSLPPVLANRGALVQILVNLIANASEACAREAAPRITIRTRFVSGSVMNVLRLGRPVKLPIEVQVSDNGPGVSPMLAGSIFEPFVSSKPQGQGLGLPLVYKLVRDMNGRITHERDEVAGLTHFRLNLPMVSEAGEAEAV